MSTSTEAQRRVERPWPAAQLTTSDINRAKHSTRDQRRAALLSAMSGAPVLSFSDGLSRLRGRLDALLLAENPDQIREARAWGERAVS